MTAAAASAALTRAEMRQIYRSPASILFSVGLPLLAIVILALIPAARVERAAFGGLSVIEAFTAPIVMFSVTMTGVMVMPQTLGTHRESGFLRRLRTTPIAPSNLLVATIAVHAVLAVVVASVIVLVTIAAGGRAPDHPLLLAAVILLMSAVFLAVGAVLCALIPTVKVLAGVGNLVAILMLFCAGLWIPRAVMPDWARTLTDLTPGGASAELLNTALAGGHGSWPDVLVCLVWTGVSVVVAVRVFRWD
ncbi:ABC transporter permease [Brachybacterium fresconis]|uniref:Transport permease protein n=1 Tax=Brachybacterium fresconis TaxID=173363 RepID=A0ABS4YIP2_9MICO|nr:ABC transporter permease [Brachybacterium fresconis]MBP2408480.1 ABC-2 type transport system permease protein [Brachybacterium fresconis]